MDSRVKLPRQLLILGTVFALLVLIQHFSLHDSRGLRLAEIETAMVKVSTAYILHLGDNGTRAYCSGEEESVFENIAREKGRTVVHDSKELNLHSEIAGEQGVNVDKTLTMDDHPVQIEKFKGKFKQGNGRMEETDSYPKEAGLETLPGASSGILTKGIENVRTDFSILSAADNMSSMSSVKQDAQTKQKNDAEKLYRNHMMKKRQHSTSISQMNSLLLRSVDSSNYKRPHWSSARDQELLSARLQIENAPVLRNTPGLYASLYRNVSMFKRSYEIMESKFKVYVYGEGEKPIFHQATLGGIYASEGWFIKLMEGNKQFVVRDPGKAHLFFLPFSVKSLRTLLNGQDSRGWRGLVEYVDDYVGMIAGKYSFWNRTDGADHFLAACHDWALAVTRKRMRNCIRAICNANLERGFKIGEDTTLPVTYVRKVEDPLRDLGGNPPSKRRTLAFFAGSMHGYLRPILLQYWENKEPDMKIFGSLPRDSQGKKAYREHMRSSRFCICARGYEVHTPRIVEAIFHGCVPVVISDNYVPPFFEVLNWEAFAVFIQEKDIRNLRNTLLSIPEKKYLAMQRRVQMVQRHFLWHKNPVKYDLFHMILHSVWYNRLSKIKST